MTQFTRHELVYGRPWGNESGIWLSGTFVRADSDGDVHVDLTDDIPVPEGYQKNQRYILVGGTVTRTPPFLPTAFITLDSGTRATFPSGMQRDTQAGKPRYDLIPLWFLRELAELMARGAEKYGDRNWEQANSPEEVARMDASGLRHHFQYLEGDKTENHLAATVFNLFAAETTRRKGERQ